MTFPPLLAHRKCHQLDMVPVMSRWSSDPALCFHSNIDWTVSAPVCGKSLLCSKCRVFFFSFQQAAAVAPSVKRLVTKSSCHEELNAKHSADFSVRVNRLANEMVTLIQVALVSQLANTLAACVHHVFTFTFSPHTSVSLQYLSFTGWQTLTCLAVT